MTPQEYGAFVEGKADASRRIMTVCIPACDQHEGYHSIVLNIASTCPICGGMRGEPFAALSYDGSRRLNVHSWLNPCGHIDSYAAVRAEAKVNGLNGVSKS